MCGSFYSSHYHSHTTIVILRCLSRLHYLMKSSLHCSFEPVLLWAENDKEKVRNQTKDLLQRSRLQWAMSDQWTQQLLKTNVFKHTSQISINTHNCDPTMFVLNNLISPQDNLDASEFFFEYHSQNFKFLFYTLDHISKTLDMILTRYNYLKQTLSYDQDWKYHLFQQIACLVWIWLDSVYKK